MTEESIEERAKEIGWIPKEEFKGNPDLWTPAEEFLKRGENFIPFLKKQLKEVREDLDNVRFATKQEIEKIRSQGYEQAKAEYEAKIDAIKKEKLKAVEDSDTDAFIDAEKREAALVKPKKADQPSVDPAFTEWHKNNEWYTPDVTKPGTADVELSEYANFVSAKFMSANPEAKPQELFSFVEKEVKRLFPHKFENPNRQQKSKAGSSNNAPVSTGKKTWADVPPEGKAAYERARKLIETRGGTFTKDEYVAKYEWSE